MTEGQRKMNIGPKAATPGGSFTSRDKILGDIDEQKLRSMENAQSDAKQAKTDADEKERLDAIDNLLPKEVGSSFGEVSYAMFKERYETVWTQVADKMHLSRGFCIYEWEVAPDVSVMIRTLKTGEMKFLRRFTPVTDPAEDPAKYLDEDALFRNARFVIAVTRFDGQELPDVDVPKARILTQDIVTAWMNDTPVSDRFDWVYDIPEELGDKIAGVFVDLSIAYRFALQENLKNQFAPPSPM
jgi:hypothetical protein